MSRQESFKSRDAGSYDSLAGDFDRLTQRYSTYVVDMMLDKLSLSKTATLLDIGCGTGLLALAAAKRFGENIKITGIDLSDGMLNFARESAARMNVESLVDFQKADAEALPFPDNFTDGAVSLYAFRHFPQPDKAMRELYRVIKQGGRAVIAVGSAPALLSGTGVLAAFSTPGRIAAEALGRRRTACCHLDTLVEEHLPKGDQDEIASWAKGHHGFSGSLESLVREAGFTAISQDWRGKTFKETSIEDFWKLQSTFSSLARKRIAAASDKDVAHLKLRFEEDCQSVLKKNGVLVYEVGAAIITAQK